MAPPHTGEVPSQEAELPSSLTRALSRTSIDNSTDGGPCGAHIGELASKAPRVTVLQEEDAAANLDQLEADTIEGLSKAVKRLSSLYFYDDKGSQLFRDITDQKEYYLTAAEAEILATHGRAILAAAGVGATSGPVNVIELGAGDGCKTVSLLGHLTASGADYEYAPIDISREAMRLLFSMLARSKAGAGVRVHGIVGDYLHALDFVVSGPPSSLLPSTSGSLEGTSVNGSQASSDDAQKVDGANDDVAGSGNTATAGVSTPPKNLVVFLGSSLGNFDPATALAFLRDIRARLRSGDCLLIGYDLKKSPATLLPAYSDAAGVTAAFNYNLLDRLNRDVGATLTRAPSSTTPCTTPWRGRWSRTSSPPAAKSCTSAAGRGGPSSRSMRGSRSTPSTPTSTLRRRWGGWPTSRASPSSATSLTRRDGTSTRSGRSRNGGTCRTGVRSDCAGRAAMSLCTDLPFGNELVRTLCSGSVCWRRLLARLLVPSRVVAMICYHCRPLCFLALIPRSVYAFPATKN
eukprot:TRINITY_DN1332_c0_g1_i1.p1 TRINITY_DN1332_c0_g1~~TRINITY_DN1332_c0_g1_i1.p1  ORF type:complete len:562 (-),score=113.96 TRINITY_DN1332_c0_g1_i1:26-1579(-)